MTLEEKRKKNTEYARLWRSKPENRKKKRAADKRYKEKNYAKCKASWDKWRKENKEHVKLRNRNYFLKIKIIQNKKELNIMKNTEKNYQNITKKEEKNLK